MNAIVDSVHSRRMVARVIVPTNVRALESKGLEVSNLDGVEYRVAGRVVFYPKNGFWRFLDGTRQGYGASRLIPALSEPAPARVPITSIAALVRVLDNRPKSRKPAEGRDSIAARGDLTAPSPTVAIAESSAGPIVCENTASRLPEVWP